MGDGQNPEENREANSNLPYLFSSHISCSSMSWGLVISLA